MRKEVEEVLIKNSRIACANSFWMPTIIGCIIISVIYLTAGNILFQWVWIFLSIYSFYKREQNIKLVKKEIK